MFGDLVRAYRRRLGMTQEELAERAGVSVRSVGKWEAGRVAAPRLWTVRMLADAFGLDGADRDRFTRSATDEDADDITPAQLPPDPPAFTGRDREVAALDALLAGAATGVLISAVSGTAGVGKTTLAVHWAHRVRDRFPDGQLYVNLRGFDAAGPPVPAGEALRGLLDGLGVAPRRIPENLAARAALYRSVLAGRRLLILLDNAADAEQVRPLLPGVPGCLVIVTSRDRLTGLAVAEGAQPVLLDVLSPGGSRDLLARRIGTGRVRSEPQAVDQIVTACARLPLALAVIAARAAAHPGFPLAAIATELTRGGKPRTKPSEELRAARSRLDVLAGPDPATDVRAVFSWSYRRLTPAAARLFRLLGLHPSTAAGSAAVASLAGLPPAQVRPLLAELCAANLLTETEPGRFECHDLLRDYARDLAVETDPASDREAATLRVLDHYLHTATDADWLLNPHRGVGQQPPEPAPGVRPEPVADSTAAMTWFSHESPALRAALDLAVSSGLDLQAWWLAWGMTTFYERRWDKHAWLDCQRTGLAAAERAGDRLLQAISRYNVGYVHAELGDLDRARAHFAEALAGYRAAGNVRGQAMVHLNLGITARKQGRYDDALAEGEEARRLYGTIDDHLGQARALNNIGWCHLTIGDHRRALDYCRRSVAVHEAAGNRMGAAHSWDSVGMAHFRLGEIDEALACYRRALASFRDQHDRQYEAIVLGHIGDAEQAAGRPRPARHAWRRALGILTELDHPDADGIRAKLADREVGLVPRSSITFPYNSRESV